MCREDRAGVSVSSLLSDFADAHRRQTRQSMEEAHGAQLGEWGMNQGKRILISIPVLPGRSSKIKTGLRALALGYE